MELKNWMSDELIELFCLVAIALRWDDSDKMEITTDYRNGR